MPTRNQATLPNRSRRFSYVGAAHFEPKIDA
jgi:hypothetical protein